MQQNLFQLFIVHCPPGSAAPIYQHMSETILLLTETQNGDHFTMLIGV